MTNKQQIQRAFVLLGFFFLAFAGLGWRLVDLQVWQHGKLLAEAERTTERKFWQPAKRGDILDANGNSLATSIPVKTVWVNPERLASQKLLPEAPQMFARLLAPLLQMDEAKILEKMQPRLRQTTNGVTTNKYWAIKHQVPEPLWQQIQVTLKTLPTYVDTRAWKKSDRQALTNLCVSVIGADSEQMRVYPNGSLAAQVIGFVAGTDSTNHAPSLVGRDGIEMSFNDKLSGVDGWRVTEVDRAHRERASGRDQDVQARDGRNVMLTIDARVQDIVESELAKAMKDHEPVSVTGIVMRPRTGEILAMAQLPTFDANRIRKEDSNSIPNRVISDVMEPGSTFKTLVISGALNEHIVTLNDQVFCENGLFAYAGLRLHDSEGHHFPNLPVWQVLQKSSNIGAAKIGMKMGGPLLRDYMMAFGLGTRTTGISLPHEANTEPYVPTLDAWNKKKYLIAQVPMGQGVAVTRLQMVMAIGAIANGGVLMRPMLVKNLQDHGAVVQKYEPESVRTVITKETARQMTAAMKTVVEKGGTAELAKMDNYVVAGKTGTAQKVVNGRYASDRFVVSFIGFFPADNPELCISVVMDSPKEGGHAYGGTLCGPLFKDIAERCASYLNIPPDKNMAATNSLVAANEIRTVRNP